MSALVQPMMFIVKSCRKHMPKFSIITPVYNAERFLRECLDSILAQTNPDWECICVDDGSSDSSLKILANYSNRDLRFKVIHQGNAGPGVARNAALDIAKGEWVLFVDSDDVIAPYTLDTVLQIANGADVVRMGLRRFPADGDFCRLLVGQDEFEFETESFSAITYSLYMDGWVQFAYQRSVIGDMRLKPYIVGEDIAFKVEYFSKSKTISHTDRLVYGYRSNQDSITHQRFSRRILHDGLCWRCDTYEAMKKSGKKIDRRIIALEAYFWGRLLPARSCTLPVGESESVLGLWYARLPIFIEMNGLRLYWLLIFRLLLILPHRRIVVVALCCWPYWVRMFVASLLKQCHLR